MREWNKGFSYDDKGTGNSFKVNFDVSVQVYDQSDPNSEPGFMTKHNPFNDDNFVEVTNNASRSHVWDGHTGTWRGQGGNNSSLANDDPAPHEFGHLLGLADRYTDAGGIEKGWGGNMMAEPTPYGSVQQKNIDALLSHVFGSESTKAYEDYNRRVEANKDNYRWSKVLGLPNIQNTVNPTYNTTINRRSFTW